MNSYLLPIRGEVYFSLSLIGSRVELIKAHFVPNKCRIGRSEKDPSSPALVFSKQVLTSDFHLGHTCVLFSLECFMAVTI